MAASSLPEINCSGWNNSLYLPVLTSSMTFGSKSTYKALGTYLPLPVSLKKVENPSSPPFGLSKPSCKYPSGLIPCS